MKAVEQVEVGDVYRLPTGRARIIEKIVRYPEARDERSGALLAPESIVLYHPSGMVQVEPGALVPVD